MRSFLTIAALTTALGLVGCERGTELDTRTFQLRYIEGGEARHLLEPYVFTDREGAPGMIQGTGSALTVRETPDNLARIERMLTELDRPRPLIMLHFQIIRADGASDADPAIAEVERELRRLFRFEGYELLAEARMGANEGAMIRQLMRGGGEEFLIEGGVSDVRTQEEGATLTMEVRLSASEVGEALRTQVTAPVGHTVVLGTLETGDSGALILVVRAEVAGMGGTAPADSRAPASG